MYTKEMLGLEEARVAGEAALAEANKDPDRPVTIAVVDYDGDLVYFVRKDNAAPNQVHMAMNKAYTAARMRRDTREFGERNLASNWTSVEWGDSHYTGVPGGVCIRKSDGAVVGAIGVSGRIPGVDKLTDADLAAAGANAVHL